MFNSRRYSGINRVNTHTLVLLSFGSTSYGTETGGATTKTKKKRGTRWRNFFSSLSQHKADNKVGGGGGSDPIVFFSSCLLSLFSLPLLLMMTDINSELEKKVNPESGQSVCVCA